MDSINLWFTRLYLIAFALRVKWYRIRQDARVGSDHDRA